MNEKTLAMKCLMMACDWMTGAVNHLSGCGDDLESTDEIKLQEGVRLKFNGPSLLSWSAAFLTPSD